MLVVEPKPDHKRAIGQPLLTLEQVEHLTRISSNVMITLPLG